MFRFGFFGRLLLALLIVGFLLAGGTALYRFGWAQGYQVGALATNTGSQAGAPQAPYYGFYPPMRFWPGYPGFLSPFWPFLGIGFFLLFFFLVGGLFRFWGWRRWGGYYGPGPWGPGYGPHGERDWRERGEGGPDKGVDAAETPPQNGS